MTYRIFIYFQCEVEPQWLAEDIVGESAAKQKGLAIRNNGLVGEILNTGPGFVYTKSDTIEKVLVTPLV